MKEYDIIYLICTPAFYKIKLLNEIAKKKKVLAIFMYEMGNTRNKDFYLGEKHFDYISLQDFGKFGAYVKLIKTIFTISYKSMVICGWDTYFAWLTAILSPKKKNSIVVESGIYESITTGLKGFIKRIFLSRISLGLCSGEPHIALLRALGFKGKCIKTYGVGLYNMIPQPPFQERSEVKNFLFVGRFVAVKNLEFLIKAFAKRPNLTLNIAGFGELEEQLKSIASHNVKFLGAVENKKIFNTYKQNDVFVLPSISEPWGLVVEEALNCGTPVLLSSKIGCRDDVLEEGKNGLSFDERNENSLLEAIDKICDVELYNNMRKFISFRDCQAIENRQIQAYFDLDK